MAALVAIPNLSQADAANLNPDLVASCDLKVMLVLDGSESLGDSELDPGGYLLPKVQTSAAAFLASLADTGVSVGVTSYATRAKVLLPLTAVSGRSIVPGRAHHRALADYVDIARADDSAEGLGTYTNWEDGLLKAHTALSDASDPSSTTLIVHLTDGAPSAWTDLEGTGPANESIADGISAGFVNEQAVSAAVAVADIAQQNGTHITNVAIGQALDSELYRSYLRRTSGNDVVEPPYQDIDVATTDVVVTDFVLVQQVMGDLGAALCTSGRQPAANLKVDKLTLTPNAVIGDDVTFEITVRNTGSAALGDLEIEDPLAPMCNRTITELPAGGHYSYTCVLKNNRLGTGSAAIATGIDPDGNTVGPVSSS